jgi:aminoglycoside phosphotransferase (APT) family kinase protein
MRLHHDEVPIDLALVRRLLAEQAPGLADRPLRAAPAQGTDNLMFTLGEDLVVRLPRKAAAVESLLVERRWLSRLAPGLPLAVPIQVLDGEPSDGYPYPWAVCRWLPGTSMAPGGLPSADVSVLAEFVTALRSADPTGAPRISPGRRAGPLAAYDGRFREALDAAAAVDSELVDVDRARMVWKDGLDAGSWPRPGVWVHRDLYGDNLLSVDGRLTGVIDFGGLRVGDPAGDVMAAFHVVRPADRPVFRSLLGVDDGTWARARAWTLVQGLEALPYYLHTHPGMVAMSRQAIGATLDDRGG